MGGIKPHPPQTSLSHSPVVKVSFHSPSATSLFCPKGNPSRKEDCVARMLTLENFTIHRALPTRSWWGGGGTGSLRTGTGSLETGTGSLRTGTGSLETGTGSLETGTVRMRGGRRGRRRVAIWSRHLIATVREGWSKRVLWTINIYVDIFIWWLAVLRNRKLFLCLAVLQAVLQAK